MNSADNKEHLQALIGEDYQLQWIVGHGGMSTVWLADDVRNDREVALKVLRPEFSDNNEFLSRFRNEAKAAESIDSENVVATYDYRELEDNGRTFCYMALEYIRGESLADLLAREGALPETLALDVMEQASHGLSVIHHMGLVHRDIKPGNLMITQNGQVKITDFGIAKAAAAVPLTRTGMVVGTAQYVSPEQAQGYEVGPSSDVYSLGVVGYEMLAGKRPFSGDSSVSVALAHISQAPEPLSTSISAPTRELIGMALRKDPNTRFVDGNEFTNAISAVRQGQRPPQPKSAALAPVAAEPSPSASTEMLANMAHPTTVRPAVSAPQTEERPAKQGGFGTGLLIAVAIAALVAIGFMAYRLWGNTTPTPQPTPTEVIVTETVEPETTEEEETEAPETVEITTVEEEPTQVTVTTTHSVIPSPPTTAHRTTQQEPPALPTEETQPQVDDSPLPEPELDSQNNPTEESALQGGQ
ncbi:serine/threonine protein kinase [Corynebacterium aurimucosum]|uniref:non-specific serine/threonine protein kinase n=2 Tax=Corynebacterium TaxID=1716 RepID=A0A558GII4_9CORY|nr:MULTISPECIES: serine/threonine-protein kinase [unclassified Corynebacterium]OFL23967.1 serine/threonine protein kinase [Corynebacterium sp. HMSC062A03]OFS41364.1 serine/threonine protein kinase [Corynebacterium sp. HMSC069E04]TVU56682.1 serine/threonine protein kinase [Corynebacterium aurimucosum]